MPIYDYSCSNCGRVTEVIHRINDPGPKFCPECGAEGTMRKALSTPAIVFKGSGWAKVDRRSSSGSSATRSSKGHSGDGSGSGRSEGSGASASSGSGGSSGSREGGGRHEGSETAGSGSGASSGSSAGSGTGGDSGGGSASTAKSDD